MALGRIFIVVNGKILNKDYSHLVTLQTDHRNRTRRETSKVQTTKEKIDRQPDAWAYKKSCLSKEITRMLRTTSYSYRICGSGMKNIQTDRERERGGEKEVLKE